MIDVEKLVKFLKTDQNGLAEIVGKDASSISKVKKGKMDFPGDWKKIIMDLHGVNVDDFDDGIPFGSNPEEKNIYSNKYKLSEENNKLHSPIQDANSKYLKPFPFSGFELEISVLEPSAHVGYVDAIETNVEPKLPTTQIRTSYASDQGNYMIYIMHDRRLEDGTDNTIFQGTEILVKEIPKEKWKDKLRFKFHHILVVRPEGIALYDVIDHNAETGEITCTSYNPEFPTEVIKLDSVLKLFYALRKLSEPIKKKK